MKSSLFSQGSWRNLICFKGNSIWLFYKAHHNHAVGDVLSKNQVVRMFTKWDPFIIEMENNKSHPLSWRGIMTMIIRVMMISLSLLLIFYKPHLLSCAAHCGDFHPSTPFNHQPPLQWRNILTNFYPLNYIVIQCNGWIFTIYFFISCGMHKDHAPNSSMWSPVLVLF